MAPDAAINLIDTQQKTWTQLYPADAAPVPVHRAPAIR
jgi:hypothetical protein